MDLSHTTLGHYRIEEEVGRGGMAVVYRAVDTRTGRPIALKVLASHLVHDPVNQRRFLREGHHAAELQHENIVRIDETGELDGQFYIAMEFVAGNTLADHLRKQKHRLNADEALRILRQAAKGLDYAHDHGFVHRDIKPNNLIIEYDGRVVITDFGVAKLINTDHTAYTIAGTTVGTPAYMSPEQAQGAKVDRRSDVYSLGVIAYLLLTGRLPFDADSQPALLHKIVYEPPVPAGELNPNIPPGQLYALDRVLAKSPPVRYPTAGAFVDALEEGASWVPSKTDEQMLRMELISRPPITNQGVVASNRKRRNAGLILLMIALLAIGGLLFLLAGSASVRELVGGDSPAPGNPNTNSLRLVTLASYEAPDGLYTINAPRDWPRTIQEASGSQLINMDAPDQPARLFIWRSSSLQESDDTRLLANFLDETELPFSAISPIDEHELTAADDNVMAGRRYAATWLGRRMIMTLSSIRADGYDVVIGSIVDEREAETFAPLHNAIVESLTLHPAELAEVTNKPDSGTATSAAIEAPSDTSTSTPAPATTNTPTPSATPTDPATPTRSSTSTPLPIPTSTGNPRAAAVALAPSPASTATDTVTPTNTPTSTATASSTNTPSPSATTTPSSTPTDAPTHTAQPSPTRTPTQTPTTALTSTPLPTATATNTAARIATATATRTATPRPTSTPLPTATLTQTATATRTATATGTPTVTPRPTSTPLPTATPTRPATATPTITRTRTPSPTPMPTATAVPTSTASPTPSNPTNTPVPQPVGPPAGAAVSLLEPLETTLSGRRVFSWQPDNLTLAENQYFELVFWPIESSAMSSGFGPVGSVKATSVTVDLDAAADSLPQLDRNRDYYWGVLLVELEPYRRIAHLGTGSQFQIPGGNGGGGDGGGGSEPCPGCGGR